MRRTKDKKGEKQRSTKDCTEKTKNLIQVFPAPLVANSEVSHE
jgi:hypothetical protein